MRERLIDPAVHTVYGSLPEFLEAGEYPAGVLTVMHRGLPIDVLHDPRGFDVTTVFFHAALSSEAPRWPLFAGRRMSEDLPTNRIHVADPSLILSEKLRLGWFAGNSSQPKLQSALRFILRALILPGQRAVTFGSSGGGFASLFYAQRLPGATAVAVNPQTNLARYNRSSVDRYTRVAWSIEGTGKIAEVPAVTDLVRTYSSRVDTRVFYVQNTGDRHVERHMAPFMEALHPTNAVEPVLVDVGRGHRPPSTPFMKGVLASAIRGDSTPSHQGDVGGADSADDLYHLNASAS